MKPIRPIKINGPDWKKLIRDHERMILNGFWILMSKKFLDNKAAGEGVSVGGE